MRAIILAGGKGTRLAPYTHVLPKPLMPIGDMPIMEVMLRQMKRASINEVTLSVGHLSSLLEAYFQQGERWGMHISYSLEEMPLGTAGPLSLLNDINETFIVTNGDVLTTLDLKKLIKFHHDHSAFATIAMHQRRVKIDFGVIDCDGNQRIVGYKEKPSYDYLVSMGIYIFEPSVLSYIPHNQYLDFPDLVLRLIDAGEKVMGYPFEGYWQDLGRPDDYQQATLDFEKMRAEFLKEE